MLDVLKGLEGSSGFSLLQNLVDFLTCYVSLPECNMFVGGTSFDHITGAPTSYKWGEITPASRVKFHPSFLF